MSEQRAVATAGGDVRLARAGLVMAAGTLTSRVLGLIRVSLLGGIIGTTGLAADAFGVANTLPNQFYLILAGGILNAVLVPQIVKSMTHDDGGQEFVNRLVTLALMLLVGATVLVTVAAPLLVMAFSKVRSGPAFHLAVAFAFICLPQVFFYGLYTLLGQILNANNRFADPARCRSPCRRSSSSSPCAAWDSGIARSGGSAASDWARRERSPRGPSRP